jgi:hypothetical protein
MTSIFPLWTFHLYVATFQQHLHMEYISLSCSEFGNFVITFIWYYIPEIVVHIYTHKTKDRVTRNQLKTGGELMCSGRVSSSCSTGGTRRVNLVTNPVKSHEWGNDREVLTTSGTYPWSFVTQIFHSDQPSHDSESADFNLTNWKPWFSSFLVSSNPLSKKSWYEPQALEYSINWEIYTPYAGAAGMLLHINGKFTKRS